MTALRAGRVVGLEGLEGLEGLDMPAA
jgi:hypothetical protein